MADFIRAIKHPQISFKGLRPDLTNGKAVLDKHGIPCSAYGGFGCVIKYETFVPEHKLWGIKCYNVLPPGLEEHYGKVTKYLNNCPAKRHFLEVSFSTDGIRVKDKVYPILKMEWSEGVDLYQYLQVNISDSKKLSLLADEWRKVCNVLMSYGIAHGDIQHGNIHVLEKGGTINIKLIDYDSLFFSVSGDICKDTIKGLDGYQHPKRKTVVNRCIQPDYFSYLVVYISILALAEDGNLWKELDLDNKEHLLFSLKDFENPFQSEIFKTLTCGFSNKVKTLTKALIDFCDVEDVSKLSSVQKLLLQYPALSREIKQSPNGLYSVKDTNQNNSHSPSISIPNRIKKRPGGIYNIKKNNANLSDEIKKRKDEEQSLNLPDFVSLPLSKHQISPKPTNNVNPDQVNPNSKIPLHKNSQKGSQVSLIISKLVLNLLAAAFVTFPFFCGLILVTSIASAWNDSPLNHFIFDRFEEDVHVYQDDKFIPIKIRLRHGILREFKKNTSMLFWVEYPKNKSLFKSKIGLVRVKESLKLWKYSGGSKPDPEDYAGTINFTEVAPFEGYGHFQAKPNQTHKAWLIRVRPYF